MMDPFGLGAALTTPQYVSIVIIAFTLLILILILGSSPCDLGVLNV